MQHHFRNKKIHKIKHEISQRCNNGIIYEISQVTTHFNAFHLLFKSVHLRLKMVE